MVLLLRWHDCRIIIFLSDVCVVVIVQKNWTVLVNNTTPLMCYLCWATLLLQFTVSLKIALVLVGNLKVEKNKAVLLFSFKLNTDSFTIFYCCFCLLTYTVNVIIMTIDRLICSSIEFLTGNNTNHTLLKYSLLFLD